MEITKGSDLILILKLEDFKSEKMRVADCADFRLYVWTANRNNFLQFSKRDIAQDEDIDRIAIPDFMMNCLESGVICYQYRYSKLDRHFDISDSHYDKSKVCVSDLYWRNCNLNEEPANPVNYQTLNYLKDLIENEALRREKDIYDLKELLKNTEVVDKIREDLQAEISRSNGVDVELFNTIKNNHNECVNTSNELSDKIDAEIKRSNEVDTEIFALIRDNNNDIVDKANDIETKLNNEIARSTAKDVEQDGKIDNEVIRAKGEEGRLDTKIDNETERAKTAEGAIRDAVENERDRAIAKETLINDTLTSEIERAKVVEKDITTSLQALKTSVEEEKERSKDKDAEHNAALNEVKTNLQTEIQRAADREEHINTDLHNEIDRAKEVEAELKNMINTNSDEINSIESSVNDNIDNFKNEVNNTLETAVKYTDIANGRKTIELSNFDSISGLDTNNIGHNLVMLSKWNVADFGAPGVKVNLNGSAERPTYNDNNDIALVEDVNNAVDYANEYTDNEVAKINANADNISNDLKAVEDKLNEEITRSTEVDKQTKLNSEAINIINGDENVIGSIKHSFEDSKHYTNDEIAKVKSSINSTLEDYATKTDVDNRIKDVIGTAPEALDTLGEIAEALNKDTDAITAINGVLTGKANKDDVYTKSEIDTKTTDLVNDIATLETTITNEVDRAKAAERLNADAIAVLNGDSSTIGSVAHCLEDAKHYTDDEIAKFNKDFATNAEVERVSNNLNAHIEEADNKYQPIGDYLTEHQSLDNYYTKEEVDNVVNGVEVDLSDYYNKTEVDEKFATIEELDNINDRFVLIERPQFISNALDFETISLSSLIESNNRIDIYNVVGVSSNIDINGLKNITIPFLNNSTTIKNMIGYKVKILDSLYNEVYSNEYEVNYEIPVKSPIKLTFKVMDDKVEATRIVNKLVITLIGEETDFNTNLYLANSSNLFDINNTHYIYTKVSSTSNWDTQKWSASNFATNYNNNRVAVRFDFGENDIKETTLQEIYDELKPTTVYNTNSYYRIAYTDTDIKNFLNTEVTEITEKEFNSPETSAIKTIPINSYISLGDTTYYRLIATNDNGRQYSNRNYVWYLKPIPVLISNNYHYPFSGKNIDKYLVVQFTKYDKNVDTSATTWTLTKITIIPSYPTLATKTEVEEIKTIASDSDTKADALTSRIEALEAVEIPSIEGLATEEYVNNIIANDIKFRDVNKRTGEDYVVYDRDGNELLIPVYERNEDGSYKIGEDDNYIPVYEYIEQVVPAFDEQGEPIVDEDGNAITTTEIVQVQLKEARKLTNLDDVFFYTNSCLTSENIYMPTVIDYDGNILYDGGTIYGAMCKVADKFEDYSYASGEIKDISKKLNAHIEEANNKYQPIGDYAKVSETTVIKDNEGNIITEMVIDNSDADDTIEVYTKEQCDNRFAKVWSGSQADYDAIEVKDNNTIYIIL